MPLFEELGQLESVEAIPVEAVWNILGSVFRTYWPLCKPAIENLRKESKLQAPYEGFEHLISVVAELEPENIESPDERILREVMEREAVQGEDEAIIGEEPPPRRSEGICRSAPNPLPSPHPLRLGTAAASPPCSGPFLAVCFFHLDEASI